MHSWRFFVGTFQSGSTIGSRAVALVLSFISEVVRLRGLTIRGDLSAVSGFTRIDRDPEESARAIGDGEACAEFCL